MCVSRSRNSLWLDSSEMPSRNRRNRCRCPFSLSGFIYLMLITDSLPEIFLLPRSIGPLNFSQTVDVFEGNLIGCYWSAGGPEESRGKQLPFNKVWHQHTYWWSFISVILLSSRPWKMNKTLHFADFPSDLLVNVDKALIVRDFNIHICNTKICVSNLKG